MVEPTGIEPATFSLRTSGPTLQIQAFCLDLLSRLRFSPKTLALLRPSSGCIPSKWPFNRMWQEETDAILNVIQRNSRNFRRFLELIIRHHQLSPSDEPHSGSPRLTRTSQFMRWLCPSPIIISGRSDNPISRPAATLAPLHGGKDGEMGILNIPPAVFWNWC